MSARCQFPVACRLQAGVLPQLVHAPTAQSLLCRWGLSMDVRGYSGAFDDCAPSFSCVLYNMGSRHAWKSEYHARSCSRASSTACAVPAALVGTQSPRPCCTLIICATKGACLEAHWASTALPSAISTHNWHAHFTVETGTCWRSNQSPTAVRYV
jgi:hypothetical protein